jgi:hypothetical protein
MRTMSKLRAFCAHPETIDRPSARRDAAAGLGNTFHDYVEQWEICLREGRPWLIDGAPEPVRGWLQRLREVFVPPEGLRAEIAVGLADLPYPEYVAVKEVAPGTHIYEPEDGVTALLTAGRADLVWPVTDDDGGYVRVCDLKSGQFYLGEPGRIRQVLGQGFACADRWRLPAFQPGIYYARLGLFDWGPIIHLDGELGRAAWDDVVESAKMSSDPNPGAWCMGCWEKNECSAFPGERVGR